MCIFLVRIKVHPIAGQIAERISAADELGITVVVFFRALLCEGHGIGVVLRIDVVVIPPAIAAAIPLAADMLDEFHGGRQRNALHRGGHNGHLQRKLPAHKGSGGCIGLADLPVVDPLVVVEGYLTVGQLTERICVAGEFQLTVVVHFRALLREGHLIGVIVRIDVVVIPPILAAAVPPAAAVYNEFHGGRYLKARHEAALLPRGRLPGVCTRALGQGGGGQQGQHHEKGQQEADRSFHVIVLLFRFWGECEPGGLACGPCRAVDRCVAVWLCRYTIQNITIK